MAAPSADLESRVGTLESRQQRTDEDMSAVMDTVLETRDDVKVLRRDVSRLRLDVDALTRKVRVLQNDVDWLKRAMRALLEHQGLSVESGDPTDDPDDDQ